MGNKLPLFINYTVSDVLLLQYEQTEMSGSRKVVILQHKGFMEDFSGFWLVFDVDTMFVQ